VHFLVVVLLAKKNQNRHLFAKKIQIDIYFYRLVDRSKNMKTIKVKTGFNQMLPGRSLTSKILTSTTANY